MLRCIDEQDKKLEMIEGDFGLILPIELEVDDEETITPQDSFSIKIFKEINGQAIIEKNYSNLQDNTINFQLSKEESERLSAGRYFYDLDWYQGNIFLGNIIAKAYLTVREKAGVPNES